MAGFVDSTVKDIDGRLRELQEEITRLQAARSALLGRSPGTARGGASSARRRRRRPGRPRGRRRGTTRASEALELVRSRPGITIPQIASELKIGPNYLYRVLPRLEREGQVKREAKGWLPA